jgi:hypothetical protein
MITPSYSDRRACDDYCPLESCVCCGLPEYGDVRVGLLHEPPIVWACHSNNRLPCVATGLDRFPENARIFTEPDLFLQAIGIEFEE